MKSESTTELLGKPELLSGDAAVAWAALDAGVRLSTAYPGTPATDIQETLQKIAAPEQIKVLWSINEKVAYETALAAGICGQRATVSMKHVGMNVAADVFIASCAGGTNGGLVLVVGDDTECNNSQGKQDSRHYCALAETMLLEPSDSQEAYSMTREAFRLSERYQLPVMIRLTNRTAYGCTPVQRQPQERKERAAIWPKDSQRFLLVPANCRNLYPRLRAKQDALAAAMERLPFTSARYSRDRGQGIGVICTGIGATLAHEFAPETAGILKIGGEPFPDHVLQRFVSAHNRILVLEEGDPVLERRVRLAAPHCCRVEGRLSGALKPVGALDPLDIRTALNEACAPAQRLDIRVPPRIPEICKPCGYNKVFAALREIQNVAIPGDIGCNSLGGLPPYNALDANWSMGSSIGVACGLAAMRIPRIVAVLGDSTFFHAGIPALIEAVHQNYALTVLVLDNGVVAMTGGQGVAHRSAASHETGVDLIQIIRATGVKTCTPFDPHALGVSGIRDLIESTFKSPGVHVLLYRSQCGLFSPGYETQPAFSLKGGK